MIAKPKRSIADLALFGGVGTFERPLHVGRPNIGDRERLLARLDEALDRRILTNGGPLVEEFEARVADTTAARHVIAVSSGTTGLQIVARAMGLDGEIIMPSFTFVGTAHAFSWVGYEPVFCDIDPELLTIDPTCIDELVGPQTCAIAGVHLWGRICDVDALEAVAARHHLPVLYDAAHAFTSARQGRPAGTFGSAEVFSFHATKFVNAFEGGAISTNDDNIARQARLMRNFGFSDWDETESLGTNGKMSEASAAMGLTSLDAMPDFVAMNRRNARLYSEGLVALSGIRLVGADIVDSTSAQHVVIRVDAKSAGLSRDELIQVLIAEGVLARRYFYPGVHRLSPYRDRPDRLNSRLPHTESVASEVISLPTGTAVSPADIGAICEIISFALTHGPAISVRLQAQGTSTSMRSTRDAPVPWPN